MSPRVQRAVERVLMFAEPSKNLSLAVVERELWTALLVLGRAVITLHLVHVTSRP